VDRLRKIASPTIVLALLAVASDLIIFTARRDRGDLDGALRDYDEAIRLEPDYAAAFYNRGVARRDRGDLDGALRDYDEAIRLGYKPLHKGSFMQRR